MTRPLDVGAEDFSREVLEYSDQPVLVDFWSETCGHCLALNPHYDRAAETMEGRLRFVKVSFQQANELFREHKVRATPTLVLFRDGVEVARKVGAMPADDLIAWLDEQLQQ